MVIDHFQDIKIQLDSEASRTQTKYMNNVEFNFFCLCPLSLTAKLNFNMSNAVYSLLRNTCQ